MPRSLRFRTVLCISMVLTALLGITVAGQPPRPVPQVRVVYVTDSLCGVEALTKRNPHVETLACMAKGARLQLWDARRGVLYEIQYVSQELRIELQNDYAGLQVSAQGLWDDDEGRVKLRGVSAFRDPASRRVQEIE